MSDVNAAPGGFRGRGFRGGRVSGFRGGGRPPQRQRDRSPIQQIRRSRIEEGPEDGPSRGFTSPRGRGRGFSSYNKDGPFRSDSGHNPQMFSRPPPPLVLRESQGAPNSGDRFMNPFAQNQPRPFNPRGGYTNNRRSFEDRNTSIGQDVNTNNMRSFDNRNPWGGSDVNTNTMRSFEERNPRGGLDVNTNNVRSFEERNPRGGLDVTTNNVRSFEERIPVKLTKEEPVSSIWEVGNPWGGGGEKKKPGEKSLLNPKYISDAGSSTSGSKSSVIIEGVGDSAPTFVRNPLHAHAPPAPQFPYQMPPPASFLPNIFHQKPQPLIPPLMQHSQPLLQMPINTSQQQPLQTPTNTSHQKPLQTPMNMIQQQPLQAPMNNFQQQLLLPTPTMQNKNLELNANQGGFRSDLPQLLSANTISFSQPPPTTNAKSEENNDISGLIIKPPVAYNNPVPNPRYFPQSNANTEPKNFTPQVQRDPVPTPPAVVVKPQPPPPPKIGIRAKPFPEKEEDVSYEMKFIELSNSYSLEVKSSPNFKTDDAGRKTYAFTIEFSNKFKSDSAEGQYFSSLSDAREHAYQVACQKVENLFSTKESFMGHALVQKRGFRSQNSWPNNSEDDKDDVIFVPKPLPANKIAALLDSPVPSPPATNKAQRSGDAMTNSPTNSSTPPFESKFKKYMDTLHMQCWLNTKKRSDNNNRLIGVEIEIQSYDKKFHNFICGDYYILEDMAKENAFQSACRKLEVLFPNELREYVSPELCPHQRTFTEIRSALGLTVRCLPETKRDSYGKLTFAFNIEFCRGGEVEIVYGDFLHDEKQAREKAFELATWRVKYLYGPDLDRVLSPELNERIRNQRPPAPPPPPVHEEPEFTSLDWEPPPKKMYYSANTSGSGQEPKTSNPSYAMVSPRIQMPPTPTTTWDLPDRSSNVEYNRTYEYRFKELTEMLNVEFYLRKIPKFEGGHKIFAFEVAFQGKSGNLPRQQSMGEYFRDEAMAKESAFKYACEQLNSRFEAQVSQHC